MKNFLVTVQADRQNSYPLMPKTYTIQKASGEGVAARRAWQLYKKEPTNKRKRMDNVSIKIKSLGATI